ncbi:MAG: HPr family phosphocarrier protein [Rhodobacteraceae bacterium]|nr:HPr family phosphocarrier protein [Paracoccaceae bacterium]
MCLNFDLQIINEKGLHARASAKFVEICENHKSQATVTFNEFTVAGDSIMGLLTLGAAQGSVLSINVAGEDKSALQNALTKLVKAGFYEEK